LKLDEKLDLHSEKRENAAAAMEEEEANGKKSK
jgi:hypothetical protein